MMNMCVVVMDTTLLMSTVLLWYERHLEGKRGTKAGGGIRYCKGLYFPTGT